MMDVLLYERAVLAGCLPSQNTRRDQKKLISPLPPPLFPNPPPYSQWAALEELERAYQVADYVAKNLSARQWDISVLVHLGWWHGLAGYITAMRLALNVQVIRKEDNSR